MSPPPVVRSDRRWSRCSAEAGMQHPASRQLHPAGQLSSDALLITSPGPALAQSPTSSQQFTVTAIRHVNFLTDFNQRKEIPFAQKQQRLRRTVTKPLTLTSRAVNGTLRSFTVPTKSSSLLKASSFTIKNAKETFKHGK